MKVRSSGFSPRGLGGMQTRVIAEYCAAQSLNLQSCAAFNSVKFGSLWDRVTGHPRYKMKSVRRAVIDIGTNSVKLLIGDVSHTSVTPLCERAEQTRLGKGLHATHRLQPDAIDRTAHAVAQFLREAERWQAASTRLIATSAARDADNRSEFTEAIWRTVGVRVEVISGEQEAAWAFEGVATDPRLVGHPLLIMDTGGGSTQFIYHGGNAGPAHHSFRLGAVRLLDQFPPSDPPTADEQSRCQAWIKEFINHQIRPALADDLPAQALASAQLVGTGGASSLLVSMHLGLNSFQRDLIEATALSRRDVQAQMERLWRLPLAERQHIPGLPPAKADVVLMGAAIHALIMTEFDFDHLLVSTRGLRFAALLTPPPER